MKTDFKVYKRKIHVYVMAVGLPHSSKPKKHYSHSTNAYRTCREAVQGAKLRQPAFDFVAYFAKD
jgi:hypothetical protein